VAKRIASFFWISSHSSCFENFRIFLFCVSALHATRFRFLPFLTKGKQACLCARFELRASHCAAPLLWEVAQGAANGRTGCALTEDTFAVELEYRPLKP
jgi:hypothetical protein